jgi:hypothetical protein
MLRAPARISQRCKSATGSLAGGLFCLLPACLSLGWLGRPPLC